MKLLAVLLYILTALLLPNSGAAADNMVISGRITDLDGKPVAGAEVYFYTSGNTRKPADFISPKATTDGDYRITLPKAGYLAIARLKKGERFGPLMPGDRHSGEPALIKPDDESEITLNFTVADMQELAQRRDKGREELAEVGGRLESGGKPVAAAYAYARIGRLTATLPEYFSNWTGSDGQYRIMLPPGRYFIGTATEFPPPDDARQLQEIEVPRGNLAVAKDLQISVK